MLGLPERAIVGSDSEDAARAKKKEIEEAMQSGGAYAFINKLPAGGDTVLEPVYNSMTNFPSDPVEELKVIVDDKQKTTSISGGESQRLAACVPCSIDYHTRLLT